MRYFDLWLGRLVEGLGRMRVFDETLMVLTADHGEGLWDHGARGHGGSLYEEQLRVPLIIHYPGQRPRDARRIAEPVSTVDAAPTILAAAGVGPPRSFLGRDLAPLTRGAKRPTSPAGIYSELALDQRRAQALRLGDFKLIRRQDRPDAPAELELYNLRSDPHERHNLAEGEPATPARHLAALDRWRAANAAAASQARRVTPEELPDGVRGELRALGYIQ